MRPVERIDDFIRLVHWDFLEERWGLQKDTLEDLINENNVIEKWKKLPDMRFGQLLINMGIISDSITRWYDEENEILNYQGVDILEYLRWGQRYDKDNNLLPETKWRLIKDLDTEHIKNILSLFEGRLRDEYKNSFNRILEEREEVKQSKIKQAVKNSRSKKIEYDNLLFDSPLEVYAYKELKKENIYFSYNTKRITLIDKFRFDGKAERAVTYMPDFIGTSFVIETKGRIFPEFKFKWKLFKKHIIENNIDCKLYMPRNQKQVREVVKEIKENIDNGIFKNEEYDCFD